MAAPGEKETMLDPFLFEALQNPRHRLTILRMELEVQRFLQDPDQQQFEFQHYPTSYLRLAAHRVAQHYGLVTMVTDSGSDGPGNRILVRKTAETRYPLVRLSEIPVKQPENGKSEVLKIVIKPRPNKGSGGEGTGMGMQRNIMRSVEERKEEYDKARARIFNRPSSSDSEDSSSSRASLDGKHTFLRGNEGEVARNLSVDIEKNLTIGESGGTSRVAIIRDREKDRFDPDYDRSYGRYVRVLPPGQNFTPMPIQLPFHEGLFPQIPMAQATLNYSHPLNPPVRNNTAIQTQWPNAAMMYAHSYEQFRQASFQGMFFQQPLSFEYLQNR
ncbi:PREDICTED: R3H domain-containing protein 2-like [Tarenaya hassleriana]|uniref:R3H domain-containing protein 2-like n=1 Tax=Tarenaya hassleriana TaxID=28532 RepID=UPI00053C9739|nr:PREDICTED: R3H domain-containing protein 2-like [Tarenaya hassleriana]